MAADSYVPSPRLLAFLQDMPLEELAFTPVSVKPRYDGWTVEQQKWFILRLAWAAVSASLPGVSK